MPKKSASLTGYFDVFEQLNELINREKTKVPEKEKIIHRIVKNFSAIEVSLAKLIKSSKSTKLIKEYYTPIEIGIVKLTGFAEVQGIQNPNSLYFILIFTDYILFIFENSFNVENPNYIQSNFYKNFPFLKLKEEISLLEEQKAMFEEKTTPSTTLQNAFSASIRSRRSLLVYCDDYVAKKIKWDPRKLKFDLSETKYFFDIQIKVGKTKSDNVSDLVKPIYLITAALEKIENVTTSLISIQKGSLVAHLFVWADDILAKEEVKTALDNSQSSLYKKVSEKFIQLELEIEDKIKILLNKRTTKSQQKLDALEIELKKLHLIKERLSNISKVSQILSEGMLESDNLSFEINGLEFIKIIDGEIHITGVNINQIS